MIVTLFKSVQQAYTRPEWIIDNTWEEIAKFLTTHQYGNTKEEVPLFNLWEFDVNGEPGRKRIYENNEPTEAYETVEGTIRRCKANAKFCHGLVLDFDGKARISEALERYNAFEAVLYTTFRHTQEKNKFRLVLPFREAAKASVIKAKRQAISETFQEVDHASFSESQSFYLHSGAEPYVYHNKGVFLDVDWFEDEVIEPIPEIRRSSEFSGDSNIYKEMLIESLATCSGLHYASDASKHGVLTLVALCKSAGFTYDEFNLICLNMAAADSSLQEENLRKSAWYSWSPFSGITAKVREDFISAYGGVSKFGGQTSEMILEKIRRKYKRNTTE